jgi:hypothetical protein
MSKAGITRERMMLLAHLRYICLEKIKGKENVVMWIRVGESYFTARSRL